MNLVNEVDFESLLSVGDLSVTGRLVDASNATLFGTVVTETGELPCIYKPVAGERPLWDFESGTLAARERAAYLVSEFLGLRIVPATVLRDGPFGYGAVQRWIDTDEEIDLIEFGQSDAKELRRMALFDAIINNTDRKFGHILVTQDSRVYGCDHGVTFHQEDKLRTVIWQFAGDALSTDEILICDQLVSQSAEIKTFLRELLSEAEISALIDRARRLYEKSTFPLPNPDWPAVPWPPV